MFYSVWEQDPTIQAMLVMLGGTKINDDKGTDIVDGIEELFSDVCQEKFYDYWQSLTSEEAPIIFYYLPLDDFGLSDDLYIKMNARGKQLTPFENFKADLIGYIRIQAKNHQEWDKLLDVRKGIPLKFDTNWTYLFWKYHSRGFEKEELNNRIDEIYYAFLNRFFWNELFVSKSQDNDYLLRVGKGKLQNGEETNTMENENRSYEYLNNDENDTQYMGLDCYKYDNNSIPRQLFVDLETVSDNYCQYEKNIPLSSWESGFEFIPRYDTKSKTELKITKLTQIYRIVFFAVCKYFKEGMGDETSLSRWMRVVWNLVSGEGDDGRPQIRTTLHVRNAIEYIDKLKSHDVYESLRSQDLVSIGKITFFEYRWNEEIEKAKQILDEDGNLSVYTGNALIENGEPYATWEDIIIDAERYAFFKGAIRFLFHNESGNVDWSQFDVKWESVRRYFRKNSTPKESAMNVAYDNAALLKALIGGFSSDNFWNILWWHYRVFNNKPQAWLYYLLNNDICASVHRILMGETSVVERTLSDDFPKNALYLLSNTQLLDFVIREIPDSWIRDYHSHRAIYPSGTGIFLNARKRNEFLLSTDGIDIRESDSCKIVDRDNKLLYGTDIDFVYKDRFFQWSCWSAPNLVYLMEDNNPDKYRIKDENKTKPMEKHYCFDANKLTSEDILKHLDDLIQQSQHTNAIL